MRDDAQVRPDHLHVYPVFLISDDHRPPQTTRAVPITATRTLRAGHWSVIWKKQELLTITKSLERAAFAFDLANCLTFPFQLGAIVDGPERVIIRRVHIVHVYVQVVWCFQEVVRKD